MTRKRRSNTQSDWGLDMSQCWRWGNPRLNTVVYGYEFAQHPGRIKIGYSSRGLQRIKEQATSFPAQPRIVFLIHHKNAKALEREMHRSLSDRKLKLIGQEWFQASREDLLAVSPHLRDATSQQTWKRPLRQAIALLVFIGVTLFLPFWGALWLTGAGDPAGTSLWNTLTTEHWNRCTTNPLNLPGCLADSVGVTLFGIRPRLGLGGQFLLFLPLLLTVLPLHPWRRQANV